MRALSRLSGGILGRGVGIGNLPEKSRQYGLNQAKDLASEYQIPGSAKTAAEALSITFRRLASANAHRSS